MYVCLIMVVSSVADMFESVELVPNQYAESAKKSQTSTDADGQPECATPYGLGSVAPN